jgi:cytochrome P450
MSDAGASLPPGRMGLPFSGEVTDFLADGFGFVEARTQRLGPVFKTKILGRPTAVIVGPDAAGQFIDESKVQREGAMLPHVQTLFGGRSLPVLDGEEHRERKAFVMAAFTRDALAGYLPEMQGQVDAAIARWATAGEVRWLDGFKRLALEAICATILGLPSGPSLDAIARDYEIVGGGFSSLPIGLPGTAYTKAKQALDRILAVYEQNIREHQAAPRPDGLGRILAARSLRDGRAITVDDAKRELHHIVVAGLFGKARETFTFAGHTIPKGWMVLWGIRSSHLRAEIYAEPERFDPSASRPRVTNRTATRTPLSPMVRATRTAGTSARATSSRRFSSRYSSPSCCAAGRNGRSLLGRTCRSTGGRFRRRRATACASGSLASRARVAPFQEALANVLPAAGRERLLRTAARGLHAAARPARRCAARRGGLEPTPIGGATLY